ncbi:hypothetical protein ANO11243_006880 [Dothideomycetidae sp. 11243]|nr:hypothetical protein ANO11243_006880 [fungal sp. No.11243]
MARLLASHSSSLFLSFVLVFFSSCSAGWVLQDDYTPQNWFSMFTFFTGADPTHGLVNYLDQATAAKDGLINTNGNQIHMGVDYTNLAPNGRASVRLTSTKSYNAGTLMILDLAHMPVGLGTWPAFWTVGPNWPAGGEIDIIEGVNNQATNAMTLHTADGCSITNNGAFSGSVSTTNCFVYAPGQSSNAGCSIGTGNTNTYGAGLNAIGGGVYAMSWTTSAISIYFFPRGSIPGDITSGNPDPTGWGKPLSQFSGGGCNIPQFFQNNQIVFDTTFCGDWAGNVWSETGGQSSGSSTCDAYVANNPGAFVDAYWKINSLKVYTVSTSSAQTTTASSDVPATTEEASNDNNSQNNNSQDDNNSQSNNNNSPSSSQNAGNVVESGSGGAVVVGSNNDNDGNTSSDSDSNSAGTTNNSGTSETTTGNTDSSGQSSAGSTSGSSGAVIVGSTGTVSSSSSPANAAADDTPQAVVVEGGAVMENNELKVRARDPAPQQTGPTGDWHAHLQREKEGRSRHNRHGRRHVKAVGPAGGVWRR